MKEEEVVLQEEEVDLHGDGLGDRDGRHLLDGAVQSRREGKDRGGYAPTTHLSLQAGWRISGAGKTRTRVLAPN